MKIGMQTWGSHGDIFPFIALADGLQSAGHDVTLAVTSGDNRDYSELASQFNLKLLHVYGRFKEVPQDVFKKVVNTRDKIKQTRLLNEYYFDPAVDEMYEVSRMLCADNDIVISHFWVHTMLTAATLKNIPRIVVTLFPISVRSNYIPGAGPNLGTWLNGLIWDLGDYLTGRQWFGNANDLRLKQGLPPIKSLQKELFISDDLTLIAASSLLCTRPPDWGENIQISGFLNIPRSEPTTALPDSLKKFLQAGDPPVYLTFGSCDKFFPEDNAKLFLDTVQSIGERAIVQSQCDSMFKNCDETKIYHLKEADHAQVFPHCKLIVHHGGAGTTQSALCAGKPSIVVEHGFDQGYWGKALVNAKVSPDLLHRKSVTPPRLAKSIIKGLSSPQFRSNASQLGKLLIKENGVKNAVEIINNRFG